MISNERIAEAKKRVQALDVTIGALPSEDEMTPKEFRQLVETALRDPDLQRLVLITMQTIIVTKRPLNKETLMEIRKNNKALAEGKPLEHPVITRPKKNSIESLGKRRLNEDGYFGEYPDEAPTIGTKVG